VRPYAQLIVGDGSRVWIYDEDLKQVTVRKLDQALGSTPAALLAGNNEAMRAFTLSDKGAKDGLEWLEALPRDKERQFREDTHGLRFFRSRSHGTHRQFRTDHGAQIRVAERNPELDPGLFRFSPPRGADVIGDVQ